MISYFGYIAISFQSTPAEISIAVCCNAAAYLSTARSISIALVTQIIDRQPIARSSEMIGTERLEVLGLNVCGPRVANPCFK